MKITDEQIEQIREATNIVDLVSEHVRLKKRGRNYVGLCPFHNEKSPSFNVLEDKGIFKCFGCGKGGDVFSFVMELEGLNFVEAAKRLAEKANIEIEPTRSPGEQRAANLRESLYAAIRAAATWYFRTLRSAEGATAMKYLAERGLETETMRKFGLGFAPEESGRLTKALRAEGFDLPVLEAAGIVARSQSGDWYERFRGRAIFPVFSPTGRVIGFGGRILPGANKELAKYINSPDTAVYHKSQVLYGLYQGKDMIRRKGLAILVEGYADVLAVHQAGFENVVAASGTSLTVDQLNLLRRYATTIVLLFDADQAGKNAAMRGIELAIEAGFDVSVVVLPGGEDPDSFIRKKGAAAFEAALERRQTFIETKAQWFEEQGAFRDPAAMAVAVRSIVETIAKVPDAIKRALFVRRLAERFLISEQMLTQELDKLSAGNRNSRERTNDRTERKAIRPQEETGVTIMVTQPVPKPEATILEAMLLDPAAVAQFFDETEFDLDLLSNRVVREIVSYLMQEVESGERPDIGQLLADYRGKEAYQQVLVECAINPSTFSDHWDEAEEETRANRALIQARHAATVLLREKITRILREVQNRIHRTTDAEEMTGLMRQSMELSQHLQSLKDFSIPDERPPVE